jgi:2'-5' RNA ligase
MRLFVAIPLPDEVIAELKRLQSELDMFGLRPVKDFHLTLKFLGDVPYQKLEILRQKLSEVEFKPFGAELSEIGVFPDPTYVRVIWAGIKAEQAYNLQKEIERKLETLGWGREKDFRPHLTIARVNFIKDKSVLNKKLAGLNPKRIKFDVTSFAIINSTLTPNGPLYETIQNYGANL